MEEAWRGKTIPRWRKFKRRDREAVPTRVRSRGSQSFQVRHCTRRRSDRSTDQRERPATPGIEEKDEVRSLTCMIDIVWKVSDSIVEWIDWSTGSLPV